jgi:hypothetical protein
MPSPAWHGGGGGGGSEGGTGDRCGDVEHLSDEEPAEESEPDARRHVVVVLDNAWRVVHEHTEILLLDYTSSCERNTQFMMASNFDFSLFLFS